MAHVFLCYFCSSKGIAKLIVFIGEYKRFDFWFHSEVKTVREMMQNKIISGMDLSLAQNELSVDLVHCAKVSKIMKCNKY